MKVRLAKKLYISREAAKKQWRIVRRIKRDKFQSDVFVIVLSENEDSLLEIYPSYIFLQPHFKGGQIRIVGISKGYNEAVELVRIMTEQCFEETGTADLKNYFKF